MLRPISNAIWPDDGVYDECIDGIEGGEGREEEGEGGDGNGGDGNGEGGEEGEGRTDGRANVGEG